VEFATWNTLHDGVIESVKGDVPGDLTISVAISYLCQKLPTSAKFLILSIRQCSHLVFAPYGGEHINDGTAIGGLSLEILSAREQDGIVSVICQTGTLALAYHGIEVKLAEGVQISQTQLEEAAQRYWTEWSEKHRTRK
jgi:hypothetical protein